jgi:MoxR-like ATPase
MRSESSRESDTHLEADLDRFKSELKRFSNGRHDLAMMALSALFAQGHVLIEDVPGVGKTTFIKALAKLCGLIATRIQFTSDMLPSDVIGVQVYDEMDRQFRFHQGPIFTDILLADELNRASPRTQSALLEAMGEGQVTIDRKTIPLTRPFIVFACQNPKDSIGTYPLPESQLDRFSVRLNMGYPEAEGEISIFQLASHDPLRDLSHGILSREKILILMDRVNSMHISSSVAQYVKRVVDKSRCSDQIKIGISTRGGLTWVRMAASYAMIEGRDYVIPDDLKRVSIPVLAHRIVTFQSGQQESQIQQIINATPLMTS